MLIAFVVNLLVVLALLVAVDDDTTESPTPGWIGYTRRSAPVDDREAPVASSTGGDGVRRWVRSIEAAAVAGIAFGVLALVGVALMLDFSDQLDSSTQAVEWLENEANTRRQIVALNAISISSIAFVWFVAVIRRRVAEREDRFFGTVFLASGIAFIGVWLAGAVAMTAPAFALAYFEGASVDEATVSLAAGHGGAYLWVVMPRIAALFVLGTATIIRRTQAMPAWLAVLSLIVGIGMLVVPVIAGPIGFVFPIWVLLVSITILIARPGRRTAPSTQ